jgi:protein-L-isoaspartate(D-aspartate) O-methyltransferase
MGMVDHARLVVLCIAGGLAAWGCTRRSDEAPRAHAPDESHAAAQPAARSEAPAVRLPALVGADERVDDRARMVARQIDAKTVDDRRGIRDARVIEAMREVPRHRFVPSSWQDQAYDDHPLPIGKGQTISQPYIVALMTEAARIDPGETVLEIGTGSGYGAAVASRLAKAVYTIEIIPELAASAGRLLAELGVANVHVRAGDGYRGWPEHAPFDAIIVTAAPDHVPKPLVDQLAVGGRLVIPVGRQEAVQVLKVITRTAAGVRDEDLLDVRFVPMTGEARE